MVKQKARQSRKQPDICFDPDALKTHLKGFSARKTARRVFGLAKQKQKERIARNQIRAETKRDSKNNNNGEKESEETVEVAIPEQDEVDDTIVHYKDVSTQQQWGGDVIVTTTTRIPDDNAEIDLLIQEQQQAKKGSEDKDQAYAGSIEKFINQVKARLPAKPKRKKSKHKGKNKNKKR
jgi:hypothetical protein